MRAIVTGGLVGGLLFAAVSCGDNQTTNPMMEQSVSAAASQSCPPTKGHPAGVIIGILTVSDPWGVDVRDDGLAYFTQVYSGGVGITTTTKRTITGFIPTGYIPTGVAFSPDGSTAYVANQGSNDVSVINVASSIVTGTVSTGGSSPFSVEVSPDGSTFYVGNNDNTLIIFDAATLQAVKTVTVGFATNAFVVDPAGRMLYASAFVSGTVTEIDMFSNNVMRTFSVGGTPQGMAINKKGNHLYIANEGGWLDDVNLITGQNGVPIPLLGGGFGVGVTPDDVHAWIAIPGAGQVQIFDMKKKKIVGSLSVGGGPRRIAFSKAGKLGAVTNTNGYITFVK